MAIEHRFLIFTFKIFIALFYIQLLFFYCLEIYYFLFFATLTIFIICNACVAYLKLKFLHYDIKR